MGLTASRDACSRWEARIVLAWGFCAKAAIATEYRRLLWARRTDRQALNSSYLSIFAAFYFSLATRPQQFFGCNHFCIFVFNVLCAILGLMTDPNSIPSIGYEHLRCAIFDIRIQVPSSLTSLGRRSRTISLGRQTDQSPSSGRM